MFRNRGRPVWPMAALAAFGFLSFVPLLLVGDMRVWLLVRNTLLLALGTCAVALPLGTGLALLLTRTDVPARRMATVTLGAMLFVPLYLQAAGWDAGFGRQGWCSLAAGSLATPLLDGWRAAIWIHGLAAVPWVSLIVGLGLQLVEPQLEEAALLEGSTWSVLVRVTLARARPSIGVSALWILVTTAGEMTVTDLYQVRTYAEEIYLAIPWVGMSDAADQEETVSVLSGIAVVWLFSVAALAATAFVAPRHHLAPTRTVRRFRLRGWRWTAGVVVILSLLCIAGVPLGNLCYKAGVAVKPAGDGVVRLWSAGKFLQVVGGSPYRFSEDFGWTLLIGGVSATTALLLAVPLAWCARRATVRSLPALLVASICLATPRPVIGVLLVRLFSSADLGIVLWLRSRTIVLPALAMLVVALPLGVLVSWYVLRTVPEAQLDAAATEGAGPWTRLLRIAAAQRISALAAAWLIALAVTTGDLAASILVVPPGVTTVPIRVFGLLHAGVDDQVAGICLVTLAGSCGIAGAAIWLLQPANRPSGPLSRLRIMDVCFEENS